MFSRGYNANIAYWTRARGRRPEYITEYRGGDKTSKSEYHGTRSSYCTFPMF
jgi:hypothetical protein